MQSTKEDSTGFQQVHRNKAKPKNTPVFEETMDHEPPPPQKKKKPTPHKWSDLPNFHTRNQKVHQSRYEE